MSFEELRAEYKRNQAQRKKNVTVYLTYEQVERLDVVHSRTRVPKNHIIRVAIDEWLARNENSPIQDWGKDETFE